MRELELGLNHPRLARLEAFEEATALLEAARDAQGRGTYLAPAAARAWKELAAAAARDGVVLELVSGFRSYEHQAQLVRAKVVAGEPLEAILRVVAPPGYSEHHTGFAADVGAPGEEALEMSFARTPAFTWLAERAPAMGWRLSYPGGNRSGYIYEPWHWRFWPPKSGNPQ
ncbi:MAG TPA: M15 family metallopeptidase [Opitutaceae bacterium]|nr:M15 family metallopeptidase [Opitutaceae bacterium]